MVHLLETSRSSLLGALLCTLIVHTTEDTLLSVRTGRLPMTTIASSPAATDEAEVDMARRASHVVAAHSTLNPDLAAGALLPVHAPSQPSHLFIRLCGSPGGFCVPAEDMLDEVVVGSLVDLGGTLHAPALEAGAAARVRRLMSSCVADERADEHFLVAVAEET